MKVKDWYYLYFENLNQTVKYSANKFDLDREKRKTMPSSLVSVRLI